MRKMSFSCLESNLDLSVVAGGWPDALVSTIHIFAQIINLLKSSRHFGLLKNINGIYSPWNGCNMMPCRWVCTGMLISP